MIVLSESETDETSFSLNQGAQRGIRRDDGFIFLTTSFTGGALGVAMSTSLSLPPLAGATNIAKIKSAYGSSPFLLQQSRSHH